MPGSHIFKVRIAVAGIPQIQPPGNMPQGIQYQNSHKYKFKQTFLTTGSRYFIFNVICHGVTSLLNIVSTVCIFSVRTR